MIRPLLLPLAVILLGWGMPSRPLVAQKPEPPTSTELDRIPETRAMLTEDRVQLEGLDVALASANQEFAEATAAYDDAAKSFTAIASDPSSDAAEKAAARRARDEAEERLRLAIERRQSLQQQVTTLRERIEVQSRLLEGLAAPAKPVPVVDANPPAPGNPPSAETPPAEEPAEPKMKLPLGTRAGAEATLDGEVEQASKVRRPVPLEFTDFSREDPALVTLRRDVLMKRARLQSLRDELNLRNQNLGALAADLQETERLLTAEREKLRSLELSLSELRQSSRSPAGDAGAGGADARIAAIETERETSRATVAQLVDRLGRLREQIVTAQRVRDDVTEQADQLSSELRVLSTRVWLLESPLAPRNLYRWLIVRGPVVLAIVILAAIAIALSRFTGRRIVAGLVRRGRRGSVTEREERAETLRRVFQSAAQTFILVLAALALLQQLGVDVTVLVGGAAVVGMAIAFGAQNLIKDYFTGFMILVENQYSVGNVIRIGNTTGAVENITMRMTMLRDLEGTVHFVPHGNVTQVSNLTHGWSRVVLDIGVGYREDTDQVVEVLRDLAIELRDDAIYGPMILGEPEVLGVESFADSAVIIKLLIKTRPLKQWEIKREMLRRTKKRFDKLGIEIPYPHRTLYLQYESSTADSLSPDADYARRL